MAVRRGEVGQFLSLLLLFLGAMLVSSSVGLYILGSINLPKVPIDFHQQFSSSSNDDYSTKSLSLCSLFGKQAQVVPSNVHGLENVITVPPAHSNEVTFQMNSVLITDAVKIHGKVEPLHVSSGNLDQKPCNDGVFQGVNDTVTINRKTGKSAASPENPAAISIDPTRASRQLPDRTGVSYHFPTHLSTNQQLEYFDVLTEQTVPLVYVQKEDVMGMQAYHYYQEVPARDLSELTLTGQDLAGKKVTSYPPLTVLVKPASWWGLSGVNLNPRAKAALQMHKFASVYRDLWVDPQSGIIIKKKEHQLITYRLREDSPIKDPKVKNFYLTVFDGTLTSDKNSTIEAISLAHDYSENYSKGAHLIPLLVLLVGLFVLIMGICLFIKEIRWRKTVEEYIYSTQFNVVPRIF